MYVFPAPITALHPQSTESSDKDFEYVHPQPMVVMHPSALPTNKPGEVTSIAMKHKTWSQWRIGREMLWTTYKPTGFAFPIGVQHHVGSNRDNIILRDLKGDAIGLLIRKGVHFPETYKMYCFQPYTRDHKPSKTHSYYHLPPFYKWATIVCGGKSVERNVTMTMVDGTVYQGECTEQIMLGLLRFKVKRNDQVCAHIDQCWFRKGLKQRPWDVVVGPGIDPGVVVVMAAILNDLIDY